jgi:hypothetical protein
MIEYMKPFITFSISVAIILLILLAITWFYKGGERFKITSVFVAGYAIGWITLFIKIYLLGLK